MTKVYHGARHQDAACRNAPDLAIPQLQSPLVDIDFLRPGGDGLWSRWRDVQSVRRVGDCALLVLVGLSVSLASAACVGPPSAGGVVLAHAAQTRVAPATTGGVEAAAEGLPPAQPGCDDWPFSDSDRRALVAQAIAFLEQLNTSGRSGANTQWTLDGVKRAYPGGLLLVNITHDDNEWLTKDALTGTELVEWLTGPHDAWPFHGMATTTLRAGDREVTVGARWQGRDAHSAAERLCVGDTEGTEGMFAGQSWVLLSATDEEVSLGFQDGVVVLFDGDPRRGFRVSGLVKPCRGM